MHSYFPVVESEPPCEKNKVPILSGIKVLINKLKRDKPCQAPNLWSKVKVSFWQFFSGITFAIGAGGA